MHIEIHNHLLRLKITHGKILVKIAWKCFYFYTGGHNIDLLVYINTSNLSSVFVECMLNQPGYTCTIIIKLYLLLITSCMVPIAR